MLWIDSTKINKWYFNISERHSGRGYKGVCSSSRGKLSVVLSSEYSLLENNYPAVWVFGVLSGTLHRITISGGKQTF